MNLRNHCCLFVLFSLCALALAQAPPAKPAPAVRTVPAEPSAPIPPRPGVPVQAKPVGTPDEPEKSPRDLLHDALKAVKFDRTPDGILNAIDALSQKPKPEKDKNKVISNASGFSPTLAAGVNWGATSSHCPTIKRPRLPTGT